MFIYDSLQKLLGTESESGKKYAIVGKDDQESPSELPQLSVSVVDLCQTTNDKNGQRLIFQEKLYEPPALFSAVFRITVSGPSYPAVLDAAGYAVSLLKDNSVIDAGDYNWHANETGKIYICPVCRQPSVAASLPAADPEVHLDYVIDFGINSGAATEFTRVKELNINADVKDDEHENKTAEK
jgi:hypothetical protein